MTANEAIWIAYAALLSAISLMITGLSVVVIVRAWQWTAFESNKLKNKDSSKNVKG